MSFRSSARTLTLAVLFLALISGILSDAIAQKTTLPDRSRRSPSITVHRKTVLLAWTGRDGRINIMSSPDGTDWSGKKVTLADKTDRGISLASDGDYAYLAWTGTDFAGSLNLLRSRDGVTWSDKVSIDESSDLGPAITVMRDRIFLAWRGKKDHRLNIMQSADGLTWRTKIVLDDTTMARPSLAATRDRLFLAWTEKPYLKPMPDSVRRNVKLPPGPIKVRRSRDGIDWGSSIRLDGKSNFTPSVSASEDQLFLSWTSTKRQRLILTSSDDGVDWTGNIQLNDQSGRSPAIAAVGGDIILAWTGRGNQQLNIDRLDRSRFGMAIGDSRNQGRGGQRNDDSGDIIPVGIFLGSPEEGARVLSAGRAGSQARITGRRDVIVIYE